MLAALSLFQDWAGIFERIWYYIDRPLTVGNFSVSIATFVTGIAVLCIALVISRWVQSFLEKRIAARTHIDPGLQYTLLRLIHYVIIAVGVLYALRVALNADLTTLAVVFTALSVGIGFGLQYIAGDIASGFILLFERPVRVGDFVTIGDTKNETQGKVMSINLRSTVVRTNDGIAVIVPNSKLVTQTMINWSYNERRARISIPVGVSYDADVESVTSQLLRAAEGVKDVLESPAPTVQFLGFGDFALDFRLLVWTARPRLHPRIKSDINYRIFSLFREAGIEIPYPQHDLRWREGTVPLNLPPRDEADEAESADDEPEFADTRS